MAKNVLIVDDEADNRMIFCSILKFRGYHVLEAADGEEGVRKARQHHPDLILMDLAMPVLDGWRATERLKADTATSDIPVVMVTAHARTLDPEEVRRAGFVDLLPKPVSPSALVAEVARVIGAA